MADFNIEPPQAISLDDAQALISTSKIRRRIRRGYFGGRVEIFAVKKFGWRRLARLPIRSPGWTTVILFAASLTVPRESTWSLILLVGAAVFASIAFNRYKRRRRRG